MMTAIATALRIAAGWIVGPAAQLGTVAGIVVLGVLAGIFVITIFRYFADAKALRAAKDQIHSALLGIVLFRHDTAVMMRHEWGLIKGALRYMKGGLRPLAVIIIPMMALIGHMGLYYAHRPLEPTEQATLTVEATEQGWQQVAEASLTPPEGIGVETPALRIPRTREVCWRLRGQSSGQGSLQIKTPTNSCTKSITVGDWTPRNPVSITRVRSGFLETLFESSEARLPAGNIQSVTVDYPATVISVGGWELHWLVPFLAAALAAGLVLKHLWGVEV